MDGNTPGRDLAVPEPTTTPAQRAPNVDLSAEALELLRDTIAEGSSEAEFSLFVRVCRRLQLDPFLKQICLIPRYSKVLGRKAYKPQITIDGYRLFAERSGRYEGQTAPEWCGADGQWRNVWLDDEPPAAARVGVWARGFREPMWGVARFSSYVQYERDGGFSEMWAKMGDAQLAKCAEALAIRRAFPVEGYGDADVEDVAVGPAARQRKPQPLRLGERATALVVQLHACKAAADVDAWLSRHGAEGEAMPDADRRAVHRVLQQTRSRVGHRKAEPKASSAPVAAKQADTPNHATEPAASHPSDGPTLIEQFAGRLRDASRIGPAEVDEVAAEFEAARQEGKLSEDELMVLKEIHGDCTQRAAALEA